ncbi:hypothetical protein GCM10022279_07900 [Comamonas faecalis]|uniref:Glycerate kinase n=1 Tax=Comamonas faecalis TaxID=1387849 RepID=A0ABP7QSJ0_9BURK
MNWRNLLIPVGIAVLVFAAYRGAGLQGLVLVGGGLLMWALLHFTRIMNVMKKAANRPIGHVGSAVMLNARLKPGVNLVHVVALTRSLGLLQSTQGEQPERYLWRDASGSSVSCEFLHGKLQRWELTRPVQDAPVEDADGPGGQAAVVECPVQDPQHSHS